MRQLRRIKGINLINLKILLPFRVFADERDVKEVVAQTAQGSYGILPNRLDCAGSLESGILTYRNHSEETIDLAIDQGVLIKVGEDIMISVRDAIGGIPLGELHQAVQRQFLDISENEKADRSSLAKMETGFIQSLIKIEHD